jgi:hypothetical protein
VRGGGVAGVLTAMCQTVAEPVEAAREPVGGLLAGLRADVLGVPRAIAWIGLLTLVSGVVLVRLYETRPTTKE